VPETSIAAGGSIRFPKLRPALRTQGKAANETLVIYAFTEKGDFETLKPPPGSYQRAGAAYAAELTSKLSAIPMRRWARTTVSYVIEPALATQP
jgi:hypothetical protein